MTPRDIHIISFRAGRHTSAFKYEEARFAESAVGDIAEIAHVTAWLLALFAVVV